MFSAKELFNEAKALFNQGNYVGSQEACEQLYSLEPKNLNVVLLLSAAHYMQGKHNKSLEILYSIPKDSQNVEIKNNIAANYLKKNQYQEALNLFFLALHETGGFVEFWLSYIIVLIKMEDNENAIKNLKMIIYAKPDVCKLHILYGRLMIKLNRLEEACTSFRTAVRLEPESDASWTGLADSFALCKKYFSAITSYGKVIELNRSLLKPYINIGLIYFTLKEFDKSIIFLKMAIKICPTKTINILPILGNAYFYTRNFATAMKIHSLFMKYN